MNEKNNQIERMEAYIPASSQVGPKTILKSGSPQIMIIHIGMIAISERDKVEFLKRFTIDLSRLKRADAF